MHKTSLITPRTNQLVLFSSMRVCVCEKSSRSDTITPSSSSETQYLLTFCYLHLYPPPTNFSSRGCHPMAEQADVWSAASRLDCHMAPLRMDRLPSHPFHLPLSHPHSGHTLPMVEPLLLRSQVSLLTLLSKPNYFDGFFTTLKWFVPG